MIHSAGQIEITIENQHEHGPIVVVAGEVDIRTAARLGAVLEPLVRDRPPRVLVDLSDVSFLDSSGLLPLLHANTIAWPDTVFAVIAIGAAARPLQLTGLDSTVAVYSNRAMALAGTDPALRELGTTVRGK
ncbi:STAS domain-containing protein [Nocardia sp. NPDC051321]|uniref:STAS domain-containing protein n=1 Tax=Nocardia sp. NPDC051321 TaxID=3364323 RepID=UPI003794673C